MRIEILQGASCSGKSSYADDLEERHLAVIVSRDRIREDILGKENLQRYFDGGMDYCLEEHITRIEHKLLAKYIIKQKDLIIIDNTNLRKKYIQEYVDIFYDLDVEPRLVKIKRFKEDIETLIERSMNRTGKVTSEEILKKQYSAMQGIDWGIEDFVITPVVVGVRYYFRASREKKKWHFCQFEVNKYFPNITKPDAIICDLDGTLAHRRVLFDKDYIKMRSYYDYSLCDTDKIDLEVADVISGMVADNKGLRVLFVSGRKESGRANTEKFIRRCFGKNFNYELFMRKEDDDRNDAVTKYEIFNKFIRDKYYVKFVIDDRDRVCAMWEELGLKVFNVGSINEHF